VKQWSSLVLVLACMLWSAQGVQAQSERACSNVRVNGKGAAGASITVDATVGGVVVAESNESRCAITFINETVNPLRCAPSTGKYPVVPTTTAGILIPASWYLTIGWAADAEWKCIRSTGTSTTLTVVEELP
jgi:hypothetical protein